jgi:hypothetical protein
MFTDVSEESAGGSIFLLIVGKCEYIRDCTAIRAATSLENSVIFTVTAVITSSDRIVSESFERYPYFMIGLFDGAFIIADFAASNGKTLAE